MYYIILFYDPSHGPPGIRDIVTQVMDLIPRQVSYTMSSANIISLMDQVLHVLKMTQVMDPLVLQIL